MTDERMALAELLEKGSDGDLLREMIGYVAQRLMELDVDGLVGVLGMGTGPSEAEPFWTQFLRGLMRRGLRGVKLVISDAHEGLKAAAARVLKASWQRCRVHFLRNALAYANKGQRQIVFALINTIFAQETAEAAHAQWRIVTDQLQAKFPKLAAMMIDAEHEVLSFLDFPKEHRVKSHSTNVRERLNGEIKRRANVVGIFPNEKAVRRLVGALLMEQNDEYAIQNRYMSLESLALLSENPTIRRPAAPALA
jgi:putative transposase